MDMTDKLLYVYRHLEMYDYLCKCLCSDVINVTAEQRDDILHSMIDVLIDDRNVIYDLM